MRDLDLDLDVDSPEKVPAVLERAAEAFYESADELGTAWQDMSAGAPWRMIAKELEKAASNIRKRL